MLSSVEQQTTRPTVEELATVMRALARDSRASCRLHAERDRVRAVWIDGDALEIAVDDRGFVRVNAQRVDAPALEIRAWFVSKRAASNLQSLRAHVRRPAASRTPCRQLA